MIGEYVHNNISNQSRCVDVNAFTWVASQAVISLVDNPNYGLWWLDIIVMKNIETILIHVSSGCYKISLYNLEMVGHLQNNT